MSKVSKRNVSIVCRSVQVGNEAVSVTFAQLTVEGCEVYTASAQGKSALRITRRGSRTYECEAVFKTKAVWIYSWIGFFDNAASAFEAGVKTHW